MVGPHRFSRRDSDHGFKLGSLCYCFSSDVILGLRKETGYRPGWRSGGHGAEGWPLCCSYKAQPAPEGHLLFSDFFSSFTLKYESTRCCKMILSHFTASTSAFLTTWRELVSLDVILSSLCLQHLLWQAFKSENIKTLNRDTWTRQTVVVEALSCWSASV